jgi:hypothetical protein
MGRGGGICSALSASGGLGCNALGAPAGTVLGFASELVAEFDEWLGVTGAARSPRQYW